MSWSFFWLWQIQRNTISINFIRAIDLRTGAAKNNKTWLLWIPLPFFPPHASSPFPTHLSSHKFLLLNPPTDYTHKLYITKLLFPSFLLLHIFEILTSEQNFSSPWALRRAHTVSPRRLLGSSSSLITVWYSWLCERVGEENGILSLE